MSDFKKFQKDIRKLGGIWNTDSVYFSQFLKGYYADYRPYYPDSSDKDISIALYSPFNKKKNITVYVGNHKGAEPLKIFNVDKYDDIPSQFINAEIISFSYIIPKKANPTPASLIYRYAKENNLNTEYYYDRLILIYRGNRYSYDHWEIQNFGDHAKITVFLKNEGIQ